MRLLFKKVPIVIQTSDVERIMVGRSTPCTEGDCAPIYYPSYHPRQWYPKTYADDTTAGHTWARIHPSLNYDRVGCIYSFYIQATAFYAFDIVIPQLWQSRLYILLLYTGHGILCLRHSHPQSRFFFFAEACPKRLRVLNSSLAVSNKEGGSKNKKIKTYSLYIPYIYIY